MKFMVSISAAVCFFMEPARACFLYLRGNMFFDACNFKRDYSDADFHLSRKFL